MAWDATHLGRGWWNANIFHPHPLALAYSEHFLPAGAAGAAGLLVTANPILGYNLVFLSTFVLSGLGMFLFARELTGRRAGAFVAGLAYAFAPYRIASLPHLQVLSSAWMPFVLFGFRRYLATGGCSRWSGRSSAWIAQNLSCGYYLLFFSPVVVVYIAWELTVRAPLDEHADRRDDRRRLRRGRGDDRAVHAAVSGAAEPAASARGAAREVDRFSADVYAYLTAAPNLRRVGRTLVRAWPKPEGALFPGLTIVALAAVACVPCLARTRASPAWFTAIGHRASRLVLSTLLFGWIDSAAAAQDHEPRPGGAGRCRRSLTIAVVALTRDPGRSPALARARPPRILSLRSPLSAVVLSLGRESRRRGGWSLNQRPYALLYSFVPGFDGLRVPAGSR